MSYGLNFRGSTFDDSSFEPRWPVEIEVLPESRVKHINVIPEQPETFYQPSSFQLDRFSIDRLFDLFLATNFAPFIRSYDENNGRTVFYYEPQTAGHVSFRC